MRKLPLTETAPQTKSIGRQQIELKRLARIFDWIPICREYVLDAGFGHEATQMNPDSLTLTYTCLMYANATLLQ